MDTRTGAHLVAAALAQEMDRDPAVIVFGEDVARLGGVFGATRGLARRFGDRRVFDTPVSETAFVGMAVGAAQAGLRPVVEIMFADFIGVCYDQVLNQMAKNTYMSGARVRVPVVLRTAAGCIGSAAQHSQVLSATFAHIPGLKVAYPASHGDLAGMLVAAVRDDNPVVVLEHKWLLKSRVPDLAFNDAAPAGAPIEERPLGALRGCAREPTSRSWAPATWSSSRCEQLLNSRLTASPLASLTCAAWCRSTALAWSAPPRPRHACSSWMTTTSNTGCAGRCWRRSLKGCSGPPRRWAGTR